MHSTPDTCSGNFLICRNSKNNTYKLYQFNPEAETLFTEVSLAANAQFDATYQVAQIGGYLLQWSGLTEKTIKDKSKEPGYDFKLVPINPNSNDPLNEQPLQTGFWPKSKFWGYRKHYSANPNEGQKLELTPMTSFVLNLIPAKGRGTFELWNFDPQPDNPGTNDPIAHTYTDQGGFALIKEGHTLIPINNYVLDRLPDGKRYRVWSFDPGQYPPLAIPAVQEGYWHHIDQDHQLTAIGDYVLDWRPDDRRYRLWRFDPNSKEALTGRDHKPIREGHLPEGVCADSSLTAVLSSEPIDTSRSEQPGNIDFMRSKIKHVVYYMLESRSFDNVCGWLYEHDAEKCHYIGDHRHFDGASKKHYNMNGDEKVHVSKYQKGKLSTSWDLIALDEDPFHDTTDNLQQMFAKLPGYWGREEPDMDGFILNSANPQVMESFSPEQLPVLNGLAKEFAISDEWFCSMPGGTDVNRGFSVAGSGYNKLGTWEGGDPYDIWPYEPHRQSIWKVLWSHGITDWKIYNAVLWEDEIFTYQLYLKGQIPSIDEQIARNDDAAFEKSFEAAVGESNNSAFDKELDKEFDATLEHDINISYSQGASPYLADLDQFKEDAKNGTLPAFSFLEPAWIAPTGSTSYHPGADLVPGEKALNEIYNALKNGRHWEETLLIVTFDKNNGLYDHVKPPYAKKPWPHDLNNGFAFDLMGPRVPTVLVSPWIKKHSVFRAEGQIPFDSTSFAATLLNWFGIPKSLWGLGDRIDQAPTFEDVFQESSAREDSPEFTPPYDKKFPPESNGCGSD